MLSENSKKAPESVYVISEKDPTADIGNNRIIGPFPDENSRIRITFKGKNNIVHFSEGIRKFYKTDIVFEGDNSVVFFCATVHRYSLKLKLEGNNTCYFGENLLMNRTQRLRAEMKKGQNLFIGRNCLFSLNIRLFTDPGGNPDDKDTRNILIGNHVWLGQKVSIAGGSVVDSGSVIGAETYVDGRYVPSHVCCAARGGEFRTIRENIMFTGRSVRNTPGDSKDLYSFISGKYLKELLELTSWNDFDKFSKVLKIKNPERRHSSLAKKFGDINTYKVPKWRKADEFTGPDGSADGREETENRILGTYKDRGGNNISFDGHGNILVFGNGVKLKDCKIDFKGNDSIVYICGSKRTYRLVVNMHCETTLYIGEGTSCSKKGNPASISAAECKSVIIGNNCRIKANSWIRTSDQHPIYDIETRKRINGPKSVIIGNGAVIEKSQLILKGTKLNFNDDNAESSALMAGICEEIDNTADADMRMKILETLHQKLGEING